MTTEKIVFNTGNFEVIKTLRNYSEAEISSQPMVYGGSWSWTRAKGGLIANDIMDAIQNRVFGLVLDQASRGYHPVIDTKVVNLMPGQYPCIPGWHCDGVIRKDKNSQPQLSTINEPIHHFICTMSTSSEEGTEIADEVIELDCDSKRLWQSVDAQLQNYEGTKLQNNQIATFTRDRLHRGAAAKNRCWRYFFRLSFYHMPAMNEIRNQVQIYTDINKGW